MRRLFRILPVLLIGSLIAVSANASPRLLLTPQRLKRLQRDRDRQTDRWSYFEKRVLTVPDSPERGFELALYFVTTGDAEQGKAALDWALAHPCERRQVALVLDWTGTLASDAQRKRLLDAACPDDKTRARFAEMRDRLFLQIVRHEDPRAEDVHLQAVPDAAELYALAEYLDAYHASQVDDLREQDPTVYLKLPTAYLLSMPPGQLEHPSWQQHVAALALVMLDPNMQSSQFLQGWALEDRFEQRTGPGVAYDFLWANSYLPGVGYQNLEPWVFWDGHAQLWARSDWSPGACWIHISSAAAQQENCASDWLRQSLQFGSLHLISMIERCIKLPEAERGQVTLLRMKPNATVSYAENSDKKTSRADAAGFWSAPDNIQGKVCMSSDAR